MAKTLVTRKLFYDNFIKAYIDLYEQVQKINMHNDKVIRRFDFGSVEFIEENDIVAYLEDKAKYWVNPVELINNIHKQFKESKEFYIDQTVEPLGYDFEMLKGILKTLNTRVNEKLGYVAHEFEEYEA